MLEYPAFFMLFTLTLLTFAAEARASCIAPDNYVCPFSADPVAAFTGTVVEGESKAYASSPSLEIRIDELSVAHETSKLVVGEVADIEVVFVGVDVKKGDRVLGYSELTCANPTQGCASKALDQEVIGVRALLDSAGLVPLGPTAQITSAEALELALDPSCDTAVKERLGTANEEVTCHDLGGCLCSAPGARPAGGLSAALGFLAIVGAWGLRRSRRAR